MKIEPRRLGRFFINWHFIEADWESIRPLFATVVVLDCRFNPERDAFEYVALSPDFSLVGPGLACATYNAEFESRPGPPGEPGETVFKGWR